MKNYTITVNGTVYEVSVEEGGAGSAPVRSSSSEGSTEGTGSSTEGTGSSSGCSSTSGKVLVPSK